MTVARFRPIIAPFATKRPTDPNSRAPAPDFGDRLPTGSLGVSG